ncbi:hypothetical protein VNO78_00653 [Psophocarpus tetragonolobus]|uniref:Uncharacterized protein n=1 Tax=Psophocarpus tetragonolobus TaxID=3891 RepID=A0AAN9XUR9_PSOTE
MLPKGTCALTPKLAHSQPQLYSIERVCLDSLGTQLRKKSSDLKSYREVVRFDIQEFCSVPPQSIAWSFMVNC